MRSIVASTLVLGAFLSFQNCGGKEFGGESSPDLSVREPEKPVVASGTEGCWGTGTEPVGILKSPQVARDCLGVDLSVPETSSGTTSAAYFLDEGD